MPNRREPALRAEEVQKFNGAIEGKVYRIVLIGVSYKTSDISYRESVYATLNRLQAELNDKESISSEFLFLTTCNRIELYFATIYPKELTDFILTRLSAANDKSNVNFYIKTDVDAVSHLYSVAAGLDSIAIGEEQILQQIREASKSARLQGTARSILSSVFDSAITTSIKLRRKYHIKELLHDSSLSSLGVQFLRDKLKKRLPVVLIIGNGKMARLAQRELEDTYLYVATSRPNNNIMNNLVKYVSYDDIRNVIKYCDIVISATRKSDYVIKYDDITFDNTLYILDLGFPRNIDPKIRNHSNVVLYNVDDLAKYDGRSKIPNLELVKEEIQTEAEGFFNWLYATRLSPVLGKLFYRAEEIRTREVKFAMKRIGNLTEEQSKVVESLTKSIVNKLFSSVVTFVRQSNINVNTDQKLELVSAMFNLRGGKDTERYSFGDKAE
jgi:glutamyl-tRNA reductase